jgi:diaminohydroxyphosphoribosylaminopyrimidine deaminase/5-amino-6-(5-phosphoribosylamino)uracil reductase
MISRQTIDEQTAWALLRALVPGSVGTARTALVTLGTADGPSLSVADDGTWTTSAPTTDDARELIDLFLPVRIPEYLVIGQLGQSLDGRIATESGASHFVTGEKDRERLHRLRALVDAVIVGTETVAQDDPRLTVRLVDGPNPVRVVLDPSARLDEARRVFTEAGESTARTLVVRRHGRATAPSAVGEGELYIPWTEAGGLDLAELLDALRAQGLRRVLVEGGGVTVSRFLAHGLLDRLQITVAPMLLGSGRPSITLDPVVTLDQAMRPVCRRFMLGEDVLFDLDLRARRA